MKRGIIDIIDAKRGTTQISKIMRGTVLIWEKIVAAVGGLADYIARVLADYGVVENETQLDLEVDFTSQDYLDAIAIYNPNGGYRTGKIYDVRDTDNTSPNDLTVTGGGGTRFLADGTLEVVPFEMPKIDYSTGQAAFLIEPARTNYELNSNTLSDWKPESFGSITANQVGITGNADDAVFIESTNTSGSFSIRMYPYLNNFASTILKISAWIKKDNDESRFIEFFIISNGDGGVESRRIVQINTKTGANTYRSLSYADGTIAVLDRGDWWELVWISHIPIVRISHFTFSPAISTTFGTYEAGATGSCILGHIGLYNSSTVNETPIITNGVVVTRTALSASIPVPAGVTSIEEKVNGVVNTITTIPATYTMPNGAVEYVKFR